MDIPLMSLIALLIAIVVSVTTSLNIGTLTIGLSLIVGNYIGGVKVPDIIKGYPTSLFILLAGTTYLFAIAQWPSWSAMGPRPAPCRPLRLRGSSRPRFSERSA